MRSRMAAEPRQYRFHKAYFRRCSSSLASWPKNSSRFIRRIGMAEDPNPTPACTANMAGRRYRDGALGMSSSMGVTGAWWIVEMDLWDAEAIDLLGPGFIEFGADRSGSFRFIAVEGWMDCHAGQRDGRPCVEFTWEGNDECDPASGRGWAVLEEDGSLRGHIYFHLGDDSGFRAVRAEAEGGRRASGGRGARRPGR